MTTNYLNESDFKVEKKSNKMSEYKFRLESEILYVSRKLTNEPVFAIIDVINLSKLLSLVKCLINSNCLEFRYDYTIDELNKLFHEQQKSNFHKVKNNEVNNFTANNLKKTDNFNYGKFINKQFDAIMSENSEENFQKGSINHNTLILSNDYTTKKLQLA